MKKISLLLIALPMILALKCEKDSRKTTHKDFDYSVEGLPDATTSGERTFAFLLDGKPWLANTDNFGQRPAYASYTQSKKRYFLRATSEIESDQISSLFFRFYKEKIVISDDYHFQELSDVTLLNRGEPESLHIDTTKTYNFKLFKLDTVNRIIAGRFEFWYYSEKDSAYHHVSKGRFDLEID